VPGERAEHFKINSKIKIILRKMYVASESSESTDKMKYAEPIFIGHAPKM
jgi:hypothetical protein